MPNYETCPGVLTTDDFKRAVASLRECESPRAPNGDFLAIVPKSTVITLKRWRILACAMCRPAEYA